MQMMQKHIDVCENDKYQNQESSYFWRGKAGL